MADWSKTAEGRDTGSSHSSCYREVDTHADAEAHAHASVTLIQTLTSVLSSPQLAEEADVFC